ncbi:hypothetical protein XA68_18470 [Ophiocordyceps unilateralis]|uniref:Uncharacterized protein n=1 Tax=Ophiocordyceps unilateralis TaxID=268505 RepID=A0A2A9P341_OPHUN|nr:hypothetical protein XA68_18470 [Ophiocordyceps unilateralis]
MPSPRAVFGRQPVRVVPPDSPVVGMGTKTKGFDRLATRWCPTILTRASMMTSTRDRGSRSRVEAVEAVEAVEGEQKQQKRDGGGSSSSSKKLPFVMELWHAHSR